MNKTQHKDIIEENLKSFKYDFIGFISSETQKVGNHLIINSFIIILLTLGIVSLSEVDTNGIKILIKTNYISLILIIINIYLFSRFYYLVKLDNLNFSIPLEIKSIINESNLLLGQYKIILDEYNIELEEINESINILQSDNSDNLKIENKQILLKKNKMLHSKIAETIEEAKSFKKLINIAENKMKIGENFLKINNYIHSYFPKIMFFVSIFAYVIRYCL